MQTCIRSAFTLIEVMVSLFLSLICLAAFQAHAVLQIRQLASTRREANASLLARSRAEYAYSIPCPSDSAIDPLPAILGVDSADGTTLRWSIQADPNIKRIEMQSRYTGMYAIRGESFSTSGRCQ